MIELGIISTKWQAKIIRVVLEKKAGLRQAQPPGFDRLSQQASAGSALAQLSSKIIFESRARMPGLPWAGSGDAK